MIEQPPAVERVTRDSLHPRLCYLPLFPPPQRQAGA